MDQALKEIKTSKIYFLLLSEQDLPTKKRKLILKQAPAEFYSVLTQIVRHLVNGTFCVEDPEYCIKYQNSLYLIALPTTTIKDKQKILATEDSDFIRILYRDLTKILEQ